MDFLRLRSVVVVPSFVLYAESFEMLKGSSDEPGSGRPPTLRSSRLRSSSFSCCRSFHVGTRLRPGSCLIRYSARRKTGTSTVVGRFRCSSFRLMTTGVDSSAAAAAPPAPPVALVGAASQHTSLSQSVPASSAERGVKMEHDTLSGTTKAASVRFASSSSCLALVGCVTEAAAPFPGSAAAAPAADAAVVTEPPVEVRSPPSRSPSSASLFRLRLASSIRASTWLRRARASAIVRSRGPAACGSAGASHTTSSSHVRASRASTVGAAASVVGSGAPIRRRFAAPFSAAVPTPSFPTPPPPSVG
mmetsp:Transcript_27245/g.71447  ORF Transcript_27245/g.71447 Transcript_27245/m.71447 type:complete len:304 (-) Transcript_27245:72-983(-)